MKRDKKHKYVVIAKNGLNLRTHPLHETNSDVIITIPHFKIIKVISDESNGWSYVEYRTKHCVYMGYCLNKYLFGIHKLSKKIE